MKTGTSNSKILTGIGICIFVALTAMAFQDSTKIKAPGQQATTDTPRPKQNINRDMTNEDIEKMMKKVDEALEKAEMKLKEIDWEKMSKDIEASLSKIDFAKIEKDVEQSLKSVDWDKMKLELDKLKDVDMKKINEDVKKAMEDVKNSFNSEEFKKSMDEIKKINMEELKEDLKKAKIEIEKDKEQMKEDLKKELKKEKEKEKGKKGDFGYILPDEFRGFIYI